MKLTGKAKKIALDNLDIIDTSIADFYIACYRQAENQNQLEDIIEAIFTSGAVDSVEEKTGRCYALFAVIKEQLDDEMNNPYKNIDDASHGYSRLQWLLSATGSWLLKYAEIEAFLLAHYGELGFKKPQPLEFPYAWEGNDDWDIGDFDKEAFDTLYGSTEWRT